MGDRCKSSESMVLQHESCLIKSPAYCPTAHLQLDDDWDFRRLSHGRSIQHLLRPQGWPVGSYLAQLRCHSRHARDHQRRSTLRRSSDTWCLRWLVPDIFSTLRPRSRSCPSPRDNICRLPGPAVYRQHSWRLRRLRHGRNDEQKCLPHSPRCLFHSSNDSINHVVFLPGDAALVDGKRTRGKGGARIAKVEKLTDR